MAFFIKRDNGYDNRVAGLDSPSQNRKNPPLRFIVLLSRGVEFRLVAYRDKFVRLAERINMNSRSIPSLSVCLPVGTAVNVPF